MVLGIGEGTIEIKTEKQSYMRGEMLRGTVTLLLKESKRARGVRIKLYAEYQSGKHRRTAYVQEKWLDSEKNYTARRIDYPFEFQTEPAHPKPMQGDGIVDGVVNALFDTDARLSWYLNASLDIPNSLDVNKVIRVEIKRE